MIRRRTPSALLLLATAWVGAVAGHTLTYVLAVPAAGARQALLASTGHSYWHAAVSVALVLGLVSAATVVVRHFRDGLHGERAMGAGGIRRLTIVLGALQVGIFLLQETLERLEAGVPIASLRTDRLLVTGVLVQLLVAAALAIALFFLARVSAAAGRALRRPPVPSPARVLLVPMPSAAIHSRLVAAGGGSRAPPR